MTSSSHPTLHPLVGRLCKSEHINGSWTHLLPLAVDALRCDGGVGVGPGQVDAVVLGDLLHLRLDGLDGLALLVGVRQGGLELLVGCDQALGTGARRDRRRVYGWKWAGLADWEAGGNTNLGTLDFGEGSKGKDEPIKI